MCAYLTKALAILFATLLPVKRLMMHNLLLIH